MTMGNEIENCDTCGEIPKSATKRHKNDVTLICCRLCGSAIRRTGHPAEAA